jgi:hypothetical protein
MSDRRADARPYADQCADLAARLREMRPALDEAIHAHVRDAVPDHGTECVEYDRGRFAAVIEAIDYALAGLAQGESFSDPAPSALITQARLAARYGVPLDTVLSRYHAGQAKLESVITKQIEQSSPVDQSAAMRLLAALHGQLNRLSTRIAVEHARETELTTRSPEQQFSERLQGLLSGSSFDTAGLDYAFDSAWHVCVIAIGPQSDRVLARLATILGRQLLSLHRGTELTWAWLGGSRLFTIEEVQTAAMRIPGTTVRLALGEPRQGFDGWRVTHRQAQAALRVALSDPNPAPLTRFADIALIEPLLRDRALGLSYVDIYLSPLNEAKDHGQAARATLRAYLGAGQQIEAAAFKLEVHRHTVSARIEAIEERLGYHISDRHAELATALDVEALLMGTVTQSESPRNPCLTPDASLGFVTKAEMPGVGR